MPPTRSKRNTLSLETREKLVEAVTVHQQSIAKAADRLMVPHQTAYSFFKHYRKTGEAKAKPKGGNRRAVLEQKHLDWIQDCLDAKPDSRVSDVLAGLKSAFAWEKPPSHRSIDRAINDKLRYTLKVLKVEPADFNSPARIEERREWCNKFSDQGKSFFNCVFIDESGFNLHQHITYGRAKVGERAIKVVPSDRGKNISYVAALGQEGIIAEWAYEGATTGKKFAQFLEEMVFPRLSFSQSVIMDNASIHKTVDVKRVFQASAHQQVYLPPYSPFLNAAEWLFAHIKPRLSKEEYSNKDSLINAIYSSSATATTSQIAGWIREVNWNMHRAMNGEILGREYHHNMAEGDEDLVGKLLYNLENLNVQV